jgi:hypothetical protein
MSTRQLLLDSQERCLRTPQLYNSITICISPAITLDGLDFFVVTTYCCFHLTARSSILDVISRLAFVFHVAFDIVRFMY